jgi:RNA 3'-terminal phosphate cyclase (ATP)
VAEDACRRLLDHHEGDSALDPHLGDQLLLPAALARGTTELRVARITGHLVTNARVIRRVLPAEIRILGREGEAGRIRVEGVGRPT